MDSIIAALRRTVGHDGVLSDTEELLVFECDGLTHYKMRPRAVVFPRSTEEVSQVVRLLNEAGVSFAPRGAGTGLSGGALAVGQGVVIELARMRRLVKLDAENRLAVVETGMVNAQLSRAAAPFGLHYVPDPSSQATCTIGGNIAENAGGIHCLKYGMTVDHVAAARVVLSDGEIVDLTSGDGGASGYDLLGVFVGSEGTFGIATEATVKLTPVAPSVRTLLADFARVDDASHAVSSIIAAGHIPAALEMVDGATIRAVEASVFAAGLPTDAEAALLVELDGVEAGLDAEAARVEAICRDAGARSLRRAAGEGERKKLWAARKGAFGAMGRISPDIMLQDAVVPRSRLPEILAEIYRIGEKYQLRVANVFHAGDGNLHPFICFDARDRAEVERVHEAGREMMETCVRAGGTITGEHGVGLDKAAYLPLVFSARDLETMLALRAAFDPSGLCNPGKIIPTPRTCGEARPVAHSRRDAAGSHDAQESGRRDEAEAASQLHLHQRRRQAALLSTDGGTHQRRRPPATLDFDRASLRLAGIVGDKYVGETRVGNQGAALAVAPASAEEATEVLRLAASEGWRVAPAGAGLWLDSIEPAAQDINLVVRTTRLARLVEHEPADLVATVEAGMTLASFNDALAHTRQWLPLDPPDDGRSTLGGVAATGLAGAHSLLYGAPRSYVLGMRVALSDGEIIKTGGRVVKNVAGYDLSKLFVGSYGTLGLILEMTLKLRPRPAREATLLARSTSLAALYEGGRASVLDAQLLPAAVELLSAGAARALHLPVEDDTHALLIRFAGTHEAVGFQLDKALAIVGAHGVASAEILTDDARLWRKLAALPLQHTDALACRAHVPPFALASLLSALPQNDNGQALWHAGLGDGRLRYIETAAREPSKQLASLRELRQAAHRFGGTLAIEQAARELKESFGARDINQAQARLARRIKQQLDAGERFTTFL